MLATHDPFLVQDLNGMLDAAKYADLVLLLVDGAFGFEMETFEFLNILQARAALPALRLARTTLAFSESTGGRVAASKGAVVLRIVQHG